MIRFQTVVGFFAIIWFVLLVRIFQISVGHGEYYETLANQNVVKKQWVHPIRGEIVDRNDRPLAVNTIGFSVNLSPHLRQRELDSAIDKIVERLDLDKDKMIARYREKNSFYNHDVIEVESFVEYDKMIPFISYFERDSAINILPATLRNYPLGDAAAHVLGYVGRYAGEGSDETSQIIGIIGKNGLEQYYNSYLQGELGYESIKVNATNERVQTLEYVSPVENNKLRITIDADLQEFVHGLFKDKAGSAIVMRTNGEMMAAISYPAFDPNMFVTGISQTQWSEIITHFDSPFTNKFKNGLYPPGSIIKMGVGLAFFDNGDVNAHSTVVCNSNFEIGGHFFRCWQRSGHGVVDFRKAIRESCDDYFYKNSLKTGINKIAEVLRETGLGERTGVDLPSEAFGTVPDIAWKNQRFNQRWYMGETVIASIGQGYMLTTPLQIARHTAMLATNKLPTPHFVVPDDIEATIYEPEVVKRNRDVMHLIRESMVEVAYAVGGTARWHVRDSKVRMAAKTGTAQVVSIPQDQKSRMDESELEYYHRSHAWMNSYAPANNPQYVVVVLIEHGKSGGAAAGPLTVEIYNWLYDNGYIKD